MHLYIATSKDPKVNDQLTFIEGELKKAINDAIGRAQALLDGGPSDTEPVHTLLADLHQIAKNLDQNRTRREVRRP